MSLNGGSAYATVFAPRTNVILGGGVQLYGAVLGKTLSLSGVGGAIHYDVQLVDRVVGVLPAAAGVSE